MSISSPCVNICQLDSQDVCTGCLRTRDEIARWTRMTEGERLSIMAALKCRQRVKDGIGMGKHRTLNVDVPAVCFDSHRRDARATNAE